MLDDNETSLTLMKDSKSQNHIKHINIMYHHVYRLVENGEILIGWILSIDMLIDNLIKALPTGLFKRHQGKWYLIA